MKNVYGEYLDIKHGKKKSRIRETLNISMCAVSRTHTMKSPHVWHFLAFRGTFLAFLLHFFFNLGAGWLCGSYICRGYIQQLCSGFIQYSDKVTW